MAVMVARSVLNATTSMLHSNSSFASLKNARSCWSRVECSLTRTSSSTSSNSPGSRVSCSATPLLVPAIPFPEVVVGEEDNVEELTFLEDVCEEEEAPASKARSSNWLTPQYLSLRLRCSALMRQEVKDALSRHFKGRRQAESPKAAEELTTSISMKPLERGHEELELMSQRYGESHVEFIKDVVIGDSYYCFDERAVR